MVLQDALWVLVCAALVFSMQINLMFLKSTPQPAGMGVLGHLFAFVVAGMGFGFVGSGVMFGESFEGIFGTSRFMLHALWWNPAVFLFHFCLNGILATASGAPFVERWGEPGRISAVLIFSVLVYPVCGHWIWNEHGLLNVLGFEQMTWISLAGVLGACVWTGMVSFLLFCGLEYVGVLTTLSQREEGFSLEAQGLLALMHEQKASGDLTKRASLDGEHEVAHIARAYNEVLDTLEAQHRELGEANVGLLQAHRKLRLAYHETHHILDTIGEGLLVVHPDMTCSGVCSRATLEMLGAPSAESLEGLSVSEVLFAEGIDPEGEESLLKTLQTAFRLFAPGQFEYLMQTAPTRILYLHPVSEEVKTFRLELSSVQEHDQVERVIVTLTDETELKRLQEANEESWQRISRSLVNLSELIYNEEGQKEAVAEFLQNAVLTTNAALTQLSDLSGENVMKLSASLQELKGNAETFQLHHLREMAQNVEYALEKIAAGHLSRKENHVAFLQSEMVGLYEGLEILNRLWGQLGARSQKSPEEIWAEFCQSTRIDAEELALSLGKKVAVAITCDVVPQEGDLELFRTIARHIVHNAVEHGIESPEEREKMWKPPEGRVIMDLHRKGKSWVATCSDDGFGIDLDRVLESAERAGLIEDAMRGGWSDEEVLEILTARNFSARDGECEMEDRMGLDAVQKVLQGAGGKISFQNVPGQGTSFVFSWVARVSTLHKHSTYAPRL